MPNDESFIFIPPHELVSKALYKIYLPETHSRIIKDFLYKVYLRKIKSENIEISKALGIRSYVDPILGLPTLNFNETNGMYSFSDMFIFFSLKYRGDNYELCIKTYVEQSYNTDDIYRKSILITNGTSKNADKAEELTQTIIRYSIANSCIKNKILRFDREKYKGEILEALEFVNIPKIELSNLFISLEKKYQFKRFIDTINTFGSQKISLRYLLNGKPGTGKTQIMNSLINETSGNCTVFLCHGGRLPVKSLFEFCSYFDPCLIVIDDLDFLASDRIANGLQNELSDFLQSLDGIIPNSVFLLAATNDKNLVDKAASRPGRFDIILDIAEIEPFHYLTLIQRETDNEKIISLFDEEILEYLRIRKVTGAFIVSLLKQIKNSVMLSGNISKQEFLNYLNLCYRGFYAVNDESLNNAVGFRS